MHFPLLKKTFHPPIKKLCAHLRVVNGRRLWKKRCNLFIRIRLEIWYSFLKAKKRLGASGFTQRKRDQQAKIVCGSKLDWLQKDMLKKKG